MIRGTDIVSFSARVDLRPQAQVLVPAEPPVGGNFAVGVTVTHTIGIGQVEKGEVGIVCRHVIKVLHRLSYEYRD